MKILHKNENYKPKKGKGTCNTCDSVIEAEELECQQDGTGALGYYWRTKEKCPVCQLSYVTIKFYNYY